MRRRDAEARDQRVARHRLGHAAVRPHGRADLVQQALQLLLRPLVVAGPARRLRLHEHDRQQPAARHRRGARPRRDRRARPLGLRDLEVGVLGQHAPLQVAEATARLEPVLLAEVPGQLAVARQRLGRTAAAVQHQQPLLLQALAQPVLGSRRLDVRGDLGMAAQRQVRVEAILERLQPGLLQARGLEADQVGVAAACERRAAPEGEGRAQQLAGRLHVPARHALARLGGQLLEAARVDVAGRDAEHVAGRAREDHPVAERAAQARHDRLHRVRRVGGRSPFPDRLDERVGRDHRPRARGQARQQRSLVAALHGDRLVVVIEDREVAQDGDPHWLPPARR